MLSLHHFKLLAQTYILGAYSSANYFPSYNRFSVVATAQINLNLNFKFIFLETAFFDADVTISQVVISRLKFGMNIL